MRRRGPADPDLLVPVSSEDVAVIGTHSLHARGEKGQAHWSGQQTWLPRSCLPGPGHLPSRVPVSSQSPSPGGFSLMTPPPLFLCIPEGPTPALAPSPHWPLRAPGWDSSRLRLKDTETMSVQYRRCTQISQLHPPFPQPSTCHPDPAAPHV